MRERKLFHLGNFQCSILSDLPSAVVCTDRNGGRDWSGSLLHSQTVGKPNPTTDANKITELRMQSLETG